METDTFLNMQGSLFLYSTAENRCVYARFSLHALMGIMSRSSDVGGDGGVGGGGAEGGSGAGGGGG